MSEVGETAIESGVVGSIIIDPEAGCYLYLYNIQVETAEATLSPLYSTLRQAEELRQATNEALRAVSLQPNLTPFEVKVDVPEKGFVMVDKELAYQKYLCDSDGILERAGPGTKSPGDIIIFDNLIVRTAGPNALPTVEVEVQEAPDSLPYSFHEHTESPSKYRELNIIVFDPGDHRIGFLVPNAAGLEPDLEIK